MGVSLCDEDGRPDGKHSENIENWWNVLHVGTWIVVSNSLVLSVACVIRFILFHGWTLKYVCMYESKDLKILEKTVNE